MNALALFEVLVLCAICVSGSSSADLQGPPETARHQEFAEAVGRLVRSLTLPDTRMQEVPTVLKDIEQAFRTRWPECQAIRCGSTVTGLALANSDVDSYVQLNRIDIDTSSGAIVEEAKAVLEQHPTLFTEVRAAANRTVPIVCFRHVPSGFDVDINFKNELSARVSELVRYMLHTDARVLNLAIVVKHWAQVHRITKNKQFSSSAMTLLLLFYLQQVGVLPAVATLQQRANSYIRYNWNAGFVEIDHNPPQNLSLYELLGGFFEYYHYNFNFAENIVSIFSGYPMERRIFEVTQNVPQEFELYKRNIELNLTQPLRCTTYICIQDPFFHSRNYAEGDYDILAAPAGRNSAFLVQFERGARSYRQDKESEFLGQILTVQDYPGHSTEL